MGTQLTVPREDLGDARRCCVEEGDPPAQCGQRARLWVGPKNSNRIDDYTEVCADHVNDVLGDGDVIVDLVTGETRQVGVP